MKSARFVPSAFLRRYNQFYPKASAPVRRFGAEVGGAPGITVAITNKIRYNEIQYKEKKDDEMKNLAV